MEYRYIITNLQTEYCLQGDSQDTEALDVKFGNLKRVWREIKYEFFCTHFHCLTTPLPPNVKVGYHFTSFTSHC